jgi:type I restriction enzyme M protein
MKSPLEIKAINNINLTSLSNQKIIQELLLLGYSQQNILLNSNFLGSNGQLFSADIIVFPENHILHINPVLIIKIIKLSEEFNYKWLNLWQNSGAKIVIWKQENFLKIFALDLKGNYKEIPPFIPSLQEINNLDNLNNDRLKSSLLPSYNLKHILANIHDHLYGNSNIRIPSRLGIEIQKLLLIKKIDEEQLTEQCEFCINLKPDDDQNLSKTEQINKIAERIRNLVYKYNLNKDEYHKISTLELNNESIYYIVFNLEGISLTKTPSDVLGDALETFRSYIMKREGGQFFTPRPVIELGLNLVGFQGESHQKLADISCGTSGFLHQARKIIIKTAEKKGIINEDEQNQLISDLLLGIEVDQDLVQISNTSPELEKLPRKIVEHHDSLIPCQLWKSELLERIYPNSQMFMVGNPPFGTKITIKNQEILVSFELARTWKKHNNKWLTTEKIVNRSPDILFIEKNIQFLKPKIGKMVLVVPYQILSGPQEGFVREWLMTN